MLFTVACINPAVDSDPGAQPLNDAEKSRFVRHAEWNSDPARALKYLRSYLKTRLDNTNPEDEDYAQLYRENAFALELAIKLLGDPRFRFDDESDLMELADEHKNMLNQRLITHAIEDATDKESFLDWVDEDSNILDKNKKIIHDILDSWIPARVTVPGEESTTDPVASPPAAGEQATTGDADFDSIFGSGGVETDTSMFGGSGAATQEQVAARVSAADALNRIKAFTF
jgi:hypothetical protein